MDTNNLQLDDASRTKLDGVVQQMSANNEPDANIQAVVDDFKQKYGNAGQAKTSQGGILSPWFPAQDTDTPIEAGAKTLGNMIPSALNTATSIVKTPIQGLMDIPKIPGALSDAYQANKGQTIPGDPNSVVPGGKLPTNAFIHNFLSSLGETLIPQATQELAKGDINSGRKTITNDPVGQILPYILIGRESAYKASPAAGASFDAAVSRFGGPGANVVNKIATIPGKMGDTLSSMGRFGVGQAIALNPETIKTVVNSEPGTFSKASMSQITRPSVASEIKGVFDTHAATMDETGKMYQPIRDNNTTVVVDHNFLKDEIQKTTGTTITEQPPKPTVKGQLPEIQIGTAKTKPGTIEATGSSVIRDPKDVRALQNFYNTWQPYFEKGQLTANEFLNMRQDLAKIAKFDREISKSGELENMSAILRGKLNTAYRRQIPGLENLDADMSSQFNDWKNEGKGIVDKDGNLTDAGINKIANSTNRGRSVFLDKLEELSPGITQRVKVLKAIEDIQNSEGQKVGAYNRAAGKVIGGGGGFMLGGPIGGLVGLVADVILTSPEATVPMMRAYGSIKGFKDALIERLKSGATAINQLPQGAPSLGSLVPKKVRGEIPVTSFTSKVDEVMKNKTDSKAVLTRKGIGDIDLVYGEEQTPSSDGFGMAKISAKDKSIIHKLPELVRDLPIKSESANRIILENEKYRVIISKDMAGTPKIWLMNAFTKRKK